jgi:hypothetical protein
VNQVEQRLVRERLYCGPADDIRRMLTPEAVKPVAGRASRLESAFSSQFLLRTAIGFGAIRVLAKRSVHRAEKDQHPHNLGEDSPDHFALLITAHLIYHRICLTQIKLFRFIGFHFVFVVARALLPAESNQKREGCFLKSNGQLKNGGIRSLHRVVRSEVSWRGGSKGECMMRLFAVVLLSWFLNLNVAYAQAASEPGSSCSIEATTYKGWSAQELSNHWLKLEVVPQNGGRLMQVIFNGHPFLFVNSKYEGKYLPPNPSQWFNYGGDKLWLLPEGNEDEQHWVGNSDLLDDGPYNFRKLSEGRECEVELTGPADPQTGIQIRRTIHIDADSPRIRFHATMQNKTGHVIEWSMQSVS